MELQTIGIGDYFVSDNPNVMLKTYALGSCVAVLFYDKEKKIAGMIHCALPESNIDTQKAMEKPGYFVDTGLAVLIETMKKKGASKHNVWIKLVGGADTLNKDLTFDIGKRNVLAVKKYLWKMTMGVIREDTGGNISRTVSLAVANGEVIVHSGPMSWTI